MGGIWLREGAAAMFTLILPALCAHLISCSTIQDSDCVRAKEKIGNIPQGAKGAVDYKEQDGRIKVNWRGIDSTEPVDENLLVQKKWPDPTTIKIVDGNDVKCLTVIEYFGFLPAIKVMPCVEGWVSQQFTTPLSCRGGQIQFAMYKTLCVDAIHPEMVQLRECDQKSDGQNFWPIKTKSDEDGLYHLFMLESSHSSRHLCFKKDFTFGLCNGRYGEEFSITQAPRNDTNMAVFKIDDLEAL